MFIDKQCKNYCSMGLMCCKPIPTRMWCFEHMNVKSKSLCKVSIILLYVHIYILYIYVYFAKFLCMC